jgi:serine-type D-Ala-D-Ala carboxypeptidase (penicillin-binding protein 5/6)
MDDPTPQEHEPLVLTHREPFTAIPPRIFKPGEQVVASVGALLLTGLVVFVGVQGWVQPEEVVTQAPLPVAVPVEVVPPTETNPYTALSLQARSAIVYDVRMDKVLYAKQGDTVLPLASLTKLMTSLVAVESLDTNSRVVVTQNALDTEGDSGLLPDEGWRLKDLVSFTMLASSNDGADALAASVGAIWQTTPETASEYDKVHSFVGRMNTRASELGLSSMKFSNATGLDEPTGELGGKGTPKDVAKLLTHIWQNAPEAIARTDEVAYTYTSSDGQVHRAENTNDFVLHTPGLIGSKTGFTDLAGGNLAILYDAGLDHPIVVVVMGSSREGRFSDVDTLVDATYDYVASGWYQYETAGSTDEG